MLVSLGIISREEMSVVKHIKKVACCILTPYWQKNSFLHCTKFSPLSIKTASPGFMTLCMPACCKHIKSQRDKLQCTISILQVPMYNLHSNTQILEKLKSETQAKLVMTCLIASARYLPE
jgi:hypothetical protein